MNNTSLDIIKNPEAERMKQMVTKGFYNRSRIALWLFEVMGREYSEMGKWAQELRLDAFIQTCSWSIDIWEFLYNIEPDYSLPLEIRKENILSKIYLRPPINPACMEDTLFKITNVPVCITEHIAPYTFKVELNETNRYALNIRLMYNTLRRLKPSHLKSLIDRFQQLFFKNNENFFFQNLNITFPVKESTLPKTLLNGSSFLDGTWLLDSSVQSFLLKNISFLLNFQQIYDNQISFGFLLGGVKQDNHLGSINLVMPLAVREATMPKTMLNGSSLLDGTWLLDSSVQSFLLKNINFGIDFQQVYDNQISFGFLLGGVKEIYNFNGVELAKISAFNLDGIRKLDSSCKLDGKFILKEAIL